MLSIAPRLSSAIRTSLALLLCLQALGASAIELPRTVDQDPGAPAIVLRGYRFHAQTFGDPTNPVLIVLHGGPGADYRYLLALQSLSDRYRVVFYDQRSTGLSPRLPAQDISVDEYMADLDAFVDHFGQGRPVHLLGHSWGAMLASAYAGQHPAKVQRLVLAEPGFLDQASLTTMGPGGLPEMRVLLGMASAWAMQWFVSAPNDPYARRDYFVGEVLPLFQANATCDGQVPTIKSWRAGSPAFDATIGRMQSDSEFAAQLSFRRGVEAFEGETLFLVGRCSPFIGEAQQRRHMKHFQRAQLVTIEDAGHFMFNDQPKRSFRVVRDFLAPH